MMTRQNATNSNRRLDVRSSFASLCAIAFMAAAPSIATAHPRGPRPPVSDAPRPMLQAPTLQPKLLRSVERWLGTPYRWGEETKGVGTDCSAFTQGLAKEAFVLDLPRTTVEQFRIGKPIRRAQLQPGDLVFFDIQATGVVDHVGFYVGDGRFVHASRSRGVVFDDLKQNYFARAYRGARRVVPHFAEIRG